MKQVGNMKLYSLEEVTDELIGQKGTPERDDFDCKVEEALHAYRIGEAIKNARLKQNLTQAELGERIGVQKAQISRMERGYSISIPTMSRVFKALGIATATLDLGIGGKVALW
ncbi:MAG: helix-turn-helix transcriptional regulator [Alloprevotella sp.]|nr:helix-turn-helix transcriptional regulator [Alloprevotella sp.]MDY6113183.1 helix-turn-helix transcriptional regulator [Alloprevotella sp.]